MFLKLQRAAPQCHLGWSSTKNEGQLTSYISYMWFLLSYRLVNLPWRWMPNENIWKMEAKVEIITSTSFVLGCPWWIQFDLSLDESQDSLDKLWQGLIKHQLLFHGICSCQVLKAFQRAIWDEGLMSWLPQIWRDFAMHHLGIRVSFSMKLPVVVIPNMDLSAKFVSYASLKLEFKQP